MLIDSSSLSQGKVRTFTQNFENGECEGKPQASVEKSLNAFNARRIRGKQGNHSEGRAGNSGQ